MTVEPATVGTILYVARKLRPADRAEIAASTGDDPVTILMQAMSNGLAFCARWRGEPCCLFGASNPWPDASGTTVSTVWMVGTDLMAAHAKELMRASRMWLPVLKNQADVLANYIDSRNTAHLRWVRAMGFQVKTDPPVVLRDPGVPFYSISLVTHAIPRTQPAPADAEDDE